MFKHLMFLVGLLAVVLTSCTPSKQVISDSAPLEKALLWKASHPRIKHDAYLFGTIHIITEEDYFLPSGTENAMEEADKFIFEIDMKEMMNFGAQISLLTKAFMKNGTRLKDLISAEDYKLIAEQFEQIGIPMMIVDRIKPMFLTFFASGEIDPGSISSGEMKSYEMEFFEYAKDNTKETGGLETLEFQISVFDSIPYKEQAEMLVESMHAEGEQSDMFRQMIDLYKTQDIEALHKEIGSEEMGVGNYEDLLLNNRNKRWISGISDHMKTGKMFFAVGAGHLGGPDGVIRLLRKAGFIVTPVIAEDGRPVKKF